MAQMNLTPLDDVLDKHFGKVGTPKRDAFESDVDEALHAYRLGEAVKKARIEQNKPLDQKNVTIYKIRLNERLRYKINKMKELLGIILLTLLVVLGSCNSNTNVSLMETSPQLFGVRQVSTGNPGYRNRELFINELEKKCKYPIEFQKNNLEAYVAVEYKTDQRGYIVKKRVVACDNKKFKKITLDIFDEVKTLKIATTEKIDTIYFQYKIQGSPTLIHSKVDVKIIGYGSNNKSILMK